jgi:FG-GAP-like repeat/Secretion system C-terminal sorting domain
MFFVVFSIFMLLSLPASAQEITFSDQILISTAMYRPNSVYSNDLDGDGDEDVLVMSKVDNKICWFENLTGIGDYGPQKIISDTNHCGEREGTVLSCDIDSDGDNDVVATSNYIYWYENLDGMGEFSSPILVTHEVNRPDDIYCIDLDGDNDFDLLSSNYDEGVVAWYENTDGLGNFGPQQILPTDTLDHPSDVFSIDLDGDGDNDVVVPDSQANMVVWFENEDGAGSFGGPQLITGNVNCPTTVYCGDIDGDGDNDCVVGSINDDLVSWFENLNGLGVFGTRQIITNQAFSPEDVMLIDLDGDDDYDVLYASDWEDRVAWCENIDGLGNFSELRDISRNMESPVTVHASDIDGDGDIDVLSAGSYSDHNNVAWYENTNGLGAYNEEHMIASTHSPQSLYSTDIDGDGDEDLLVAQAGDDKIAWYENLDGIGSFGSQQVISTSADAAHVVFAADIDGDSDIDVLSASCMDDKIAWYENIDGLGMFGPQQIITTDAEWPRSIFSADLDGDGDFDLLSASEDDDKLAWYENTDGAGNFGEQQILLICDTPFSVTSADLDGDGDNDVLAACLFEYGVLWFENLDGAGDFATFQIVDEGIDQVQFVEASDIDGDGDLDIVATNRDFPKITWYENIDGAGNFGPQNIIMNNIQTPIKTKTADIDRDGDLDLLHGGYHGVYWFENSDGLGNFSEANLISDAVYSIKDILSSDIDGDGDLDVFSASNEDDKIAWYRNEFSGIQPLPFSLLSPDSGSVILADSVMLSWEEAPDPDNNIQLYTIYISENPEDLFECIYDSSTTTEYLFRGEYDIDYYWTVSARDGHGYTSSAEELFSFNLEYVSDLDEEKNSLPDRYEISAIYPNPFNPTLNVSIALPETGNLKVSVYNLMGQSVATLSNGGQYTAGKHNFIFNANEVTSHSSGVYFVHASVAGKLNQVKKVVLMK